jgi:WD40 repeat protein
LRISRTNGKNEPVLLADSGRNFLHVWDLPSGRPPRLERYDSSTHAQFIERVDGSVVITDWRDGKRQFIDALTGAKLPWLVELPPSFEWHTTPDATLAAITESAEDEQIRIHVKEVVTGREVKSFVSKTKDVGTIAFSNDNRWLLTTSFFKRSADLWDLSTGESEHHFQGEDVVLSPDGRWVASCGPGAGITVLDLHTQVQRTFTGNCSVAFSPGGRYLATGHDGPIDVWEMGSGRHVLSLELPETTGGKFFSPDERYVVTSTTLKEDQIWQVSTGREMLPTFSRAVHQWPSVAFSEDSHWLVATAADGSIKVWDLDAEKLLASLYVLNDGESWLATTPDGYFDGGDTAVKKLVTWNVADQIYPAARFAKQRYRPGLLAGILAKAGTKP